MAQQHAHNVVVMMMVMAALAIGCTTRAAAADPDAEGAANRALEARYGRPSLYATFEGQRVVKFAGVASDDSLATEQHNGALLNSTLAALRPGDVFVIPNNTYYTMGGVLVSGLSNVTIAFEGSLVFSKNMDAWPRSTPGKKGRVLECLHFDSCTNIRFVGNPGGTTLDGNGATWWGFPGIGYLLIGENRPRLLTISSSTSVLVENLILKNSPYWTFWAPSVNGLEVRDSVVNARRDSDDGHDIIDLTAFNTDGFDFTGKNIWLHDCTVWNQDDCVAVKDGTENVLVERISASGLGLTIGSIGGSTVRNVTFRDVVMPHTYKGIYLKFRNGGGLVEDVLYQNITMQSAEQFAIWIGPAQQSDSDNLCAAHPCSICWPILPGAQCNAPYNGQYRNITLRDVTVNGATNSPGLILANTTAPMEDILFDNVVVTGAGKWPFGTGYKCEGVASGVATGTTSPVPSCFTDKTTRTLAASA